MRWNALHEKMYVVIIGSYFEIFHLISFLNFYAYLASVHRLLLYQTPHVGISPEIRDGREARNIMALMNKSLTFIFYVASGGEYNPKEFI